MRAKFKLTEKIQTENGYSLKFSPVISGSPENETFFKWTPWGEIKIGTVNSNIVDSMNVGTEYYIDFTEAQ